MASNKIEIQIQPGTNGRLRLQDFVRGLDAIIAALRATELTITGLDRPQTEFDVVDLHHSKPTVVIQGYTSPLQHDYSGRTIKRFIGAVNDISRGRAPKWMDLEVLETYKDLAEPLNENVHHVVIKNSKKHADITPRYKERIEKIIGPDQIEKGSALGMLEMISIHQRNRFALYPVIGPKRIVCNFQEELLGKVLRAVGHYVEAFGTVKYKARGQFPHEMDAEDIDIKPLKAELPRLQDLRGIADLTDENEPDDFFLALANDW